LTSNSEQKYKLSVLIYKFTCGCRGGHSSKSPPAAIPVRKAQAGFIKTGFLVLSFTALIFLQFFG